MKDYIGAEIVEVSIRKDLKTIWINVDEVCAVRVSNINNLQIRVDGKMVESPLLQRCNSEKKG